MQLNVVIGLTVAVTVAVAIVGKSTNAGSVDNVDSDTDDIDTDAPVGSSSTGINFEIQGRDTRQSEAPKTPKVK